MRASRKKIKENPVGVEDVLSHVSGTDIFEIVESTFPHQSVQGGGGEGGRTKQSGWACVNAAATLRRPGGKWRSRRDPRDDEINRRA